MVDDVTGRLNAVFQRVFQDDDLSVDRETSAKDVEDWDSVMHVTLLVNVEKAFQIKFTSAEVARLERVGDLIDLIEEKSSAR
jgi:acyl carrier protein